MSTKTIYKRIALVAVATLGAGVLSVAPASAAAVLDANMAQTGTAGTNNSIVVAGTAATAINTVTTDTALACGYKITDPLGNVAYIGTGVANATVGTATIAASVCTLTFATTYLTTTGKWAIGYVADTVAADLNTEAKIIAAYAVGASSEDTAFFVTKATPSFSGGTGRTVTSATAISQDVNGVVTVNIVADNASSSYVVSSTGVGSMTSAFATDAGFTAQTLTATANDVVVNNNGTTPAGGVTWTPAATTGKSFIQIKTSSAVAGEQKVSVTPLNASGTPGTPVTATITWGATPAVAAGTTTSVLNAGTGTTATGSDATVLVSKSATGQQANIIVTVKDQAGNALNGQTVSASISGPGLIAATATATAGTGNARVASVTLSSSQNVASIHVNADGTSGVGTISVSVGATVVATETVSFFDSPATVTAVQNHKVLSSAGGTAGITPAANAGTGADIANTPAVILTVLDKNGLRVTGLTTTQISAVSSDSTVMSETITLAQSDGTGAANTVSGNYNVQVSSVAKASGSTATLKFKVVVSAALGTFIESAPLTYTLGGAPASVALSLDKSSYSVGEAAVATLTLKDSSGNAARDGDHANILTAALTSSLAVNKALFGTTVSSLGGVATVSFNAPATSSDAWAITGTTGTGPSTAAEKGKALSASASVSNASADAATDAANEATDAANAATDAALAAADAADAATAAAQDASDAVAALSASVSKMISSLRAQITSLTNLVIKIQKKVKA